MSNGGKDPNAKRTAHEVLEAFYKADLASASILCRQQAAEIKRLREVLALGIHMREAQTTYFKTRSQDALIASKNLEKEFLDRARALLKESER